MFGYIRPDQKELKIKDYDVFRSYYCGLCKALGKRYNQVVRLGLSYDMTFLAILADSLSENPIKIKKQGCLKNRGKKTESVTFPPFCLIAKVLLFMTAFALPMCRK